nr:nucleolar GTP-binding protein 2-like [Pocillopora verrucosa]
MAKTRKKSGPEKTAKKSNSSMNPDRPKPAAGSNMRDKATVNRLKMYKSGGKAVRNKKGKIVKPAPFQSSVASGEVARVAPNRKWFGNTRVISQNALQSFQDEMGKVLNDPYKVVMQQSKLPLSLLNDKVQSARVHILDTESFGTTFGPKAQRKRPNLKAADMKGFMEAAQVSSEMYDEEKDMNLVREDDGEREEAKESLFTKGQSKRIWNELYKRRWSAHQCWWALEWLKSPILEWQSLLQLEQIRLGPGLHLSPVSPVLHTPTPGFPVCRKDLPGVGDDFSELQVMLANVLEAKEWSARASDALSQYPIKDLSWQATGVHTVYMAKPPSLFHTLLLSLAITPAALAILELISTSSDALFDTVDPRHGRVVNSIPEVTPFGIRDIGCRLVGKFFLKGLDEALSLGWVGSSAGVDAGATLCLGVVDLTRLQPDLAANKGVICVTVCAVIASRVEDAAEVLDARDPMGTRSSHIESFMKKEKQHKHLIFVLNKCDLVPTWVTQRWVTVLSADHPTLAFHASVTNPFGKGALINLLRQFAKLHTDKKEISVGVIGYPNVGKSSIINTLRAKKVCNVAPIAGETKSFNWDSTTIKFGMHGPV